MLSMAGWHRRVARVRRECERWGSRVMLEEPSVVVRSSISTLSVNIGFKERQELSPANAQEIPVTDQRRACSSSGQEGGKGQIGWWEGVSDMELSSPGDQAEVRSERGRDTRFLAGDTR